ncbi:MAG: ATP-binding protein [Flexilinea sp.]
MGIYIDRVNVKNLGPLNEFSQKLGLINLIYGHNEKGKTYLVEFIYKSLFKNMALSNPRPLSASGQLIVTGLEEKETSFSPDSRKKLEDFWVDSRPGLPGDFSKLLVVKGGDPDLSPNNPAGLDDQVLQDFLSGEVLLGKIAGKINPTESSATYENGRISGPQRGNVKKYYELTGDIKQLDGYLMDVNDRISGGKRFEIIQEIEYIKKALSFQDQAKRHLAYTLAQEISKLSADLEEIPKDILEEAQRLISKYGLNRTGFSKKKQEQAENLRKSRHYQWLETAIDEYQRLFLLENRTRDTTGTTWLIAAILSTVLAIALILIKQPYFGIGAILLTLLFGFLYLRSYKNLQSNELQKIEMEKIEQNFREKFDVETSVGTAVLLSKQKELQPVYYSLEQINNDISAYARELVDTKQDIDHILRRLTKRTVTPEEWQSMVDALQERRGNLEDEIRRKQNDLSKMDVDEATYLETPVFVPVMSPLEGRSIPVKSDEPATFGFTKDILLKQQEVMTYDRVKQNELQNLLDLKLKELKEVDVSLQQLKQAICTITRSEINIQWEDLIEKLTIKRLDVVNQYKEVTASIIAQINVNKVLDELRLIEGAKIEEGLYSSYVSQSIFATTGHYEKIEREGGELYISDRYGRYKLKELSTGAREQVLLGLRIGFASKLLAGEPLFLILDDAFQHSDWERREILVDELMDLADIGWQIIYFSMDDHIKSLFTQRVEPKFKDRYRFIELYN